MRSHHLATPDYLSEIEAYPPCNEQEENDRRVLLSYARQFPSTVLTRENEIAHITSSGFIVNPGLTHTLMVRHNLRKCWAWTGGHADGDGNLLSVALREAAEETGAAGIRAQTGRIASLDILNMPGHMKNGRYVSTHLHLSVSFILLCDDDASLSVKPDENSGVAWFSLKAIHTRNFDQADVFLYKKLCARARQGYGHQTSKQPIKT